MSPVRAIIAMFAVLGMAAALVGCDSYSNVSVNCQLGVKNDDSHIAGCEFQNTGRQEAEACVKLHVEAPESEENVFGQKTPPNTFVSEVVCSGQMEPGARTNPIPLTFEKVTAEEVAARCATENEDGEQVFNCALKVEELPPGSLN